MDWNRAKNYTILFLFLLNILLLFLNVRTNREYSIHDGDSIKILLEKNKIRLNCDIPKDFNPMPQLHMEQYNYDLVKLQDLFLIAKDNIKRTAEFDKIIFTSGKEMLSIEKNIVTYDNVDVLSHNTEQEAVKAATNYISKMKGTFGKFVLDTVAEDNEGFQINFSGVFKNRKIFNNCVVFTMNRDNGLNIVFSYVKPVSFVEKELEICSANEALFSFMAEIRKNYDDSVYIDVEQIDLGYYMDMDIEDTKRAIPHYRIIASVDGYSGHYYINAYNKSF